MTIRAEIVVADTGPLISLAFIDRLDLLLKTDAHLVILDVVYLEATSSESPDAERIRRFVAENHIELVSTERGEAIRQTGIRKRHDGERAIQDYLFEFADQAEADERDSYSTLIFEDNKVKGSAFVLPDNVFLLTTFAFLRVLEKRKIIDSADVLAEEIREAGRNFSSKDFDAPPRRNSLVRPF